MARTRQELRAIQDRHIKARVDAIVALLALAAKASHTNAQSVCEALASLENRV